MFSKTFTNVLRRQTKKYSTGEFKGKVAIITGSGRGMGALTAEMLAKNGITKKKKKNL